MAQSTQTNIQPIQQPTNIISAPQSRPLPIIPQQPQQPIAIQVAKLSKQEEDELRKAVVDYKKGRSRANAEQIINKYAVQYSHDPFVQSKLNEKAKFDSSAGIKPTKTIVQPTTLPAPITTQPNKSTIAAPAKLSKQEEDELRKAIVDYKKGRSRANAEQIINKYAAQYPHDPFVKSKLNEKAKFDVSSGIKSK